MSLDRYTDPEFLNALETEGPNRLPAGARALIRELFLRVQSIEGRPLDGRLQQLEKIAQGMAGDLEMLGRTPDNANLRDRMRSVLTAVRDLAEALADRDGDGR